MPSFRVNPLPVPGARSRDRCRTPLAIAVAPKARGFHVAHPGRVYRGEAPPYEHRPISPRMHVIFDRIARVCREDHEMMQRKYVNVSQ
jgi:hypothetical protein